MTDENPQQPPENNNKPKPKPKFSLVKPEDVPQPPQGPSMKSLKDLERAKIRLGAPERLTEHTLENAWTNLKNDTHYMFKKSFNLHAKDIVHGNHTHDAVPEVSTLDKVGIVAGSTVSLCVALHGLVNIKRGLTGFEDKELDVKQGPSLQYTVVGAAETAGGLALAKRLLTGTWKVF